MLVYPPDNHETDSKTIFLIGSFQNSAFVNGEKIKAETNGNFCKLIKLKIGLNILDLELDSKSFSRRIYRKLISAEEKNILRDFSVKKNIIEFPLKIDHAAIKIHKLDTYHLSVEISGISLKFNSIKYTSLESQIHVNDLSSEGNTVKLKISSSREIQSIETHSSSKAYKIKVHTDKKDEPSPNEGLSSKHRKANKETLSRKKYSIVCLDAGHGGPALGAVSPRGISEKELNLKLTLKIAKELKALNINYALSRECDTEIKLEDRVSFAKSFDEPLFISIHHNAVPDHCDPYKHRGFSCHYFHESSYHIAEKIAKALKKTYPLKFAGIYKQDLHVLRENRENDAVLIELGYLIHPVESILLTDAEFQDKSAKILAMAISEIVK